MLNVIPLKVSRFSIEYFSIRPVKTDSYTLFYKHTNVRHTSAQKSGTVPHTTVRNLSVAKTGQVVKAAHRVFTSSPVDLELNRDFNGDDYEYEDEAKLVIFPDHFEIPLPNIEELPALVSESLLHGSLCVFCCFGFIFFCPCMLMGGCNQWFLCQHAGWSILSAHSRFIFRVEASTHCHVF